MLSQVESIVDYLGAYTELAAALPSEPQIDFALAGLQTSPTLIEELEATRADWQQAGIAAQVGLVPIGRDPASGRWEFWLPISGERPERDEDGQLQLTAGSGLVFVLIPPGTFPMGSKAGKPEEQPVREVGLDGFFLSKFELTRAQWARLVGAEPIVDTALLPAQASWAAVHGQLTKWHLELPSEAQWEYACRAGTVTPWSIPEGAELADYAWFAERGAEGVGEERPSPEPVGQKLPNPWGLHDVHGNVSEWCSDGYHPRFYETSSTNVRNPLMPFQRTRDRVSRGGAVNEVASAQRSAARHAYLARSRRVANSVAFEPGIRPMFRLRDSLPSIWDRLSPRMLTSAKRVLPKQRAELARLLAKRPALERTLAELQVVAVASERSPRLWREIGIPPQVGLIPLGRDAKSQRWEFWVPSTGKRPDWVDGHVVPNDEMAVVMVLVPEPEPDGVFLMGSQDDDASKPNYVEGTAPFAVHPVKLSRFFISKFEMTARQWATLRRKELKAGSNGRLPITGVNWEECNRALVTAGLQLPTESQWEYACRAGTTGKYWFDASLARQRFAAPGAKKPRPVGMNSPNPFGLHDVHGNVHEWCRDWFAPYGAGNAPRPGDGLRPARGTRRVSRGGGFVHAGAFHRAATFRGNAPPSLREVEHGFRPARPVVEVAPKTLLAAEPLHDRVEESRALIADAERFWLGAVDSRKSRVWCERADVLLDQLTGVSELARALPAGPLLEEIQGLREVRMSLGRLRRLVPEIVAAAPMWEAARRDLAKDRRFAGFELEPIAYLLPLGKNASTGLWEFWAPETGAKPEWSKDPLPNAPEGSSANTLMSPESALVFVLVPGGKFQMGQSDAAPNPSRGVSIGRPRHEVTVKPFLVSKFEVTQAQWLRGLAPEAAGGPRTAAPRGGRTRRGRYGSSRNLAALPATIDPVVNVRAPDCRRFCDRFQLSLPSEAQWEYFCRAGTTTPWSIPDGAKLTDYAWFDVRATAAMSKPRRAPAPIGQKLPNPWGLHDVHGNVWEWCLDAWNPEYPNEPTDASPRWGGSGHLQIHRGGGFRNPLPECRSDARAANDAERASFPDVGLRPVLDPTRRRRLAGVRTGFVATAPSKLVGMRGPSRDSDPAPLYRVGEPVDRVLIGVSGNHGMFIDSIQPIYRVLTRDGLGKEFRGDRIGGRGGSGPTVLKAPRDWVVTGVEVRVGGEIQAMRLIYSPWRDLQSAKRATQRSKWIADPRRRGARPFELVGAAGEFVAGFAVTTSPSQGGWLRTLEVAKGRKGR
ncbi:MAG: formylglycine-generating enzyme family protein [bacterium]|nr:formylglycine-generating enzyme family protein [bacterium]